MPTHVGEIAALITAVFWTVTALAFEPATKKIGPIAANLIKLAMGALLLGCFTLVTRGMFLPFDASAHVWLWLSLSGVAGFLIGDYCLFKSYTIINARVAMLVMALAPPMAALMGWLWLGEKLITIDILGMALTLLGISLVVLKRDPGSNQLAFKHPLAGVLLALGGALGQAGGLVLSKYGMRGYHPLGPDPGDHRAGRVRPFILVDGRLAAPAGDFQRPEAAAPNDAGLRLRALLGRILFPAGGAAYLHRHSLHHHSPGSGADNTPFDNPFPPAGQLDGDHRSLSGGGRGLAFVP
jgi:uncharacterized membrane protein